VKENDSKDTSGVACVSAPELKSSATIAGRQKTNDSG
jgi:hypothetical protein